MNAVLVANADRMMTAARVVVGGIAVTFADGCSGIIPFQNLPEVKDPSTISGLENCLTPTNYS